MLKSGMLQILFVFSRGFTIHRLPLLSSETCSGRKLYTSMNASPVYTQKMNSYLKEIADLCGIKKNLSTHTARHSFASVIALANNVSLPNVAKMLGHSSTRMTQHYAKVLDQTILRDMQAVEKQLSV